MLGVSICSQKFLFLVASHQLTTSAFLKFPYIMITQALRMP